MFTGFIVILVISGDVAGLDASPGLTEQGEVDELPDLTEAEQVMEKWPDREMGDRSGLRGFLMSGG